jgi:signal transduction histidine kinase
VWTNLFVNAVDAVEGRPDAEIATIVRVRRAESATMGSESRWVEVEIRDNGTGIPPEVMNRIFEPFFTTKPSGRGTGLGLSIVYGAVKSHAGSIEVDSAPGRGTSVRICLPEKSGAPPARAPACDDLDEPALGIRSAPL